MPYSLTCRPRLTAAVRSASLWRPEPVKCWSRLPNASSGTMRRSTGSPMCVSARAPASPEEETVSIAGDALNASTSAAGSLVAATMSRSLTSSAQRRALPASSTAIADGCSRSAATSSSPTSSAFDSTMRTLGLPSAPGCQRRHDVLLGLLAEAGHVASRPSSVALRSSSSDVDAEVLVEQPGALRAEPRDPGDLDQAGGDARLELVGRGDRAGLEQGVDLLGDRLADARELLDPPLARHLLDRHARLADGLGGGAVGADAVDDRAVQLVEAGQLLEGFRDLAVPHRARVRASCRTPG